MTQLINGFKAVQSIMSSDVTCTVACARHNVKLSLLQSIASYFRYNSIGELRRESQRVKNKARVEEELTTIQLFIDLIESKGRDVEYYSDYFKDMFPVFYFDMDVLKIYGFDKYSYNQVETLLTDFPHLLKDNETDLEEIIETMDECEQQDQEALNEEIVFEPVGVNILPVNLERSPYINSPTQHLLSNQPTNRMGSPYPMKPKSTHIVIYDSSQHDYKTILRKAITTLFVYSPLCGQITCAHVSSKHSMVGLYNHDVKIELLLVDLVDNTIKTSITRLPATSVLTSVPLERLSNVIIEDDMTQIHTRSIVDLLNL